MTTSLDLGASADAANQTAMQAAVSAYVAAVSAWANAVARNVSAVGTADAAATVTIYQAANVSLVVDATALAQAVAPGSGGVAALIASLEQAVCQGVPPCAAATAPSDGCCTVALGALPGGRRRRRLEQRLEYRLEQHLEQRRRAESDAPAALDAGTVTLQIEQAAPSHRFEPLTGGAATSDLGAAVRTLGLANETADDERIVSAVVVTGLGATVQIAVPAGDADAQPSTVADELGEGVASLLTAVAGAVGVPLEALAASPAVVALASPPPPLPSSPPIMPLPQPPPPALIDSTSSAAQSTEGEGGAGSTGPIIGVVVGVGVLLGLGVWLVRARLRRKGGLCSKQPPPNPKGPEPSWIVQRPSASPRSEANSSSTPDAAARAAPADDAGNDAPCGLASESASGAPAGVLVASDSDGDDADSHPTRKTGRVTAFRL